MRFIAVLALLLSLGTLQVAGAEDEAADSKVLKALYDADQAVRSEESRKAGKYPTLQEERDRRFAVFQLIAEGKLRTANDYLHAGIIIHHTGSVASASGEQISLGTESKLLAFFLFKQAHQLGHESGRPLMAAAYNYYLRACGEDASHFGYTFDGREPIWRPNAQGDETEALKCGFDPRPYFE